MRNTPKAAGLNKKGFTLIELVVAMAVSAILGVILISTVRTGVVSYKYVDSDMMTESEARAALSLITVQIRQHDATGAIALLPEEPTAEKNAIRFIDDPASPNSTYSVVTFEANKLVAREYADLSIPSPDPVSSAEVATLSSFSISEGYGLLGEPMFNITIGYGEGKTLSQSVVQRSARVAPVGEGG